MGIIAWLKHEERTHKVRPQLSKKQQSCGDFAMMMLKTTGFYTIDGTNKPRHFFVSYLPALRSLLFFSVNTPRSSSTRA